MPRMFGEYGYWLANVVLHTDWSISVADWYGDDSYPPHPSRDEISKGGLLGFARIMGRSNDLFYRFFTVTYLEMPERNLIYGFHDTAYVRRIIQDQHVRHAFELERLRHGEKPESVGIFDVDREYYLSIGLNSPHDIEIHANIPERF